MKSNLSEQNFLIRVLVIGTFLVSVLLYPKLWVSDFSFPLIPAFTFITVPSLLVSQIILAILVILMLIFIFRPNIYVQSLLILLLISLFVTDINRLQPANYIVFLILFGINVNDKSTTSLIIILAAIYFWSGIHKINPVFHKVWLGGMNKRIDFIPEFLRILFTYSIPFLEAGFGVLLLFRRTRKFGAILLIVMHTIILCALFAMKSGESVIAINVFLIALLTIFLLKKNTENIFETISSKKIVLLLLLYLLPLFNFFGKWDHFMSFSILSGKPKYMYIAIQDKNIIEKLPTAAKKYVGPNKQFINMNYWAYDEKGIMIYPETRVYKSIADYLKNYASDTTEALIVKEF